MEKQRWEESEKRREEKRREEQRRTEKNREEQRRTEKNREENESKKEDAGAGKGGKVTIQWFVAPEGRKVGSLKRQVQSHLGRWEMKNCTPLWREAHLQVKKLKTPHIRNTFGSSDVEKDHALVARSTFPSQNVQNPPGPEHFWKLRCWKSARHCGAKHVSKSKRTKHTAFSALLEVEMFKTCTPLWREAHFEVKMYKAPQPRHTFGSSDVEKVHAVVARSTFRSQNPKKNACRATFGRWSVFLCGRRKGFCTLPKVNKTWGFCGISKTMAGVGRLKRTCKDAFRVPRAVQETCSSEMLRGVAFWSIRSSGLLRWFCVTGAALRMTRGRRNTLNKPNGKIVLKHVSQNCFVFDVVNLKSWGSLAELLRFWRCQVQKLKKPRRIAALLICQVQKLRKSRRIASFSNL